MAKENNNLNDEHYVRAVTELGDKRRIVSNCDIYSKSGIKLVAAGIQVTGELYERLVKHKLLPPLDQALSIENMLDPAGILADVNALIEGNEKLGKVAEFINLGNSYRQIIGDLRLPPPLAFKLTVAKEQFPQIYQHSLLLMIISVYLARCDDMKLYEEEWGAFASLFHDIGLLHIDPALLKSTHVMSVDERRHLYAHPLTAYLLLSEFPEVPRQVANAVLEHHERMDGSGYPRGLTESKISRLGQILAVAELAAKGFDADTPRIPWKKLDVMLKLNSRKYGQGLIGHLNIFRDNTPEWRADNADPVRMAEQARVIAKLFDVFGCELGDGCQRVVLDFAQTRLEGLRLALFSAGFDPREPEALIQLFEEDPDCISDYSPLLDETIWQFKSLLLEISRQWPDTQANVHDHLESTQCAWMDEMQLLLAGVDA